MGTYGNAYFVDAHHFTGSPAVWRWEEGGYRDSKVVWDSSFSDVGFKDKHEAEMLAAYRNAHAGGGGTVTRAQALSWFAKENGLERVNIDAAPQGRFISRLTSAERKEYPITTGFLDYFPDAVALVAHLSWAGNEKHNPGEPLHWARSKSTDQENCIGRHLIERDGADEIVLKDGRVVVVPHRVAVAWRALADLQIWAEQEYGLAMAPGARP